MANWEAIKDTVKWAGEFIEKGRPNTSLPTNMANAVPDVDDWQSLSDAKGPATINWDPSWSNLYGLTVVSFKIALNWDYGARYKNGGAFIPNVWVSVLECNVLWGFDLSLKFEPKTPENAASSGEPPHARLPVTISGTVSNWLNSREIGHDFMLYGDGSSEIR